VTRRSLWLRFYIVLLVASLAVDAPIFGLPALSVQSLPASLFIFLAGMLFPLSFRKEALQFVQQQKWLLSFALAFCLVGLISIALSSYPALMGLKCLFSYGLYFSVALLLLFLFSLEKSLGLFFLKTIAALGVILALISFGEVTHEQLYRFLADTFRNGEYQIVDGRFRAGATLGHPNLFGCFMALAVFIFFHLKDEFALKATLFYPAIGILCAATALSGSRNAALVLILPLLLISLHRKTLKPAAIGLFLAIAAILFLSPGASRYADVVNLPAWQNNTSSHNDSSAPAQINTAASRLDLWRAAASMFADHPAFGIGPGAYNGALKDYASKRLLTYDREKIEKGHLNAHNGFFNILAEFGLVGIIVVFISSLYCFLLFIGRAGLYPPGPAHALLAAIFLSFMPDAFFYSPFYMVTTLTLVFLFTFGKSHRPSIVSDAS